MINKKGILKKVFVLTLVGGLAFWLSNFAISRTAIDKTKAWIRTKNGLPYDYGGSGNPGRSPNEPRYAE